MEIFECIESRRSIRSYKEGKLSNEIINKLLKAGTMAPTGLGKESWGFVVIQDKNEINEWSEKIKAHILENIEQYEFLKPMQHILEKPDFSVFHNAENLIVVFGCTESHSYISDCTLAAENIMLAARSMDIGSCWIGFSQFLFDNAEFKNTYNVPDNYSLVCSITLGYTEQKFGNAQRKEPLIFNL